MRSYIQAAYTFGALLAIALASPLLRTVGAQVAGTDSDAEQKVKAYEESCIGNLRTINVAQGTYWGGDPKKGFARNLKNLGPKGEGLIVQALASGRKDGYHFILRPMPTETSKPVSRYTISARPIKLLVKDQRSFFTNETGLIRSTAENRAATAADPPIN
jgi:hypothetical protein